MTTALLLLLIPSQHQEVQCCNLPTLDPHFIVQQLWALYRAKQTEAGLHLDSLHDPLNTFDLVFWRISGVRVAYDIWLVFTVHLGYLRQVSAACHLIYMLDLGLCCTKGRYNSRDG